MSKVKIPKNVIKILDTLRNNNYEAYLVGGCVRDMVLNKEPNDWDITTSATPDKILSLFDNTIPTGLKHGTVTVVMDKEQYEVTTFRIDGFYSDGRHPDEVTFTTDLTKDLSRRDFTINAMAYDHRDESIIDPFGGLKDLKLKTIKCVGKPSLRFKEDPLRMLRAVRFSAQLGFSVEMWTSFEISRLYREMYCISAERIQQELNKILLSNKVEVLNSSLAEYVLRWHIPEFIDLERVRQNNPYHVYNVQEHSVMAASIIEKDLVLRLAALFHDLGKSKTKSTDENGVDHFYGHAKESAKMAREILARLRYSNKIIDEVSFLIEMHDRRIENLTLKSMRRLMNAFDNDLILLDKFLKLRRADVLSQNLKYAINRLDKIDLIKSKIREVVENNNPITIRHLLIDGNDLIQIGLKGKDIGNCLKYLLEEVLEEPSLNKKEELIKLAKKYYKEML